jgi:Fe-S-cluster containining protein
LSRYIDIPQCNWGWRPDERARKNFPRLLAVSSNLSRAEREALERQDARFLVLPLQAPADQQAVLAHLRHTARLLRDRQASSPSARAVTHVNALFDRSIPEIAKKTLACRQGCAHCCHQPVIVYGPELFFLAAHIRGRAGMTEKLLIAADAGRGQARRKSTPCPLLEGDACTVYEARPLSCHAFVSQDVNDCISTFRYLKERTIRTPQIHNALRNICRMILLAAAKALGLPIHAYELNSVALAAILAQDNAEKRWLRGEDVLAEVAIIPPGIPPEIRAEIDRMAALAAPAL